MFWTSFITLVPVKKHIPNVLTSFNLFCGCLAAILVLKGVFMTAAYLVFLAAFFDMLDGMIARKVGANSAFGKEFDSLADVVTFGFVPGAILFMLMKESGIEVWADEPLIQKVILYFPFIVTVFSGLRLAKFNIDTRQSTSFLGLPTPANTLMIVSFPLILIQYPGKFDSLILNPIFIIGMSLISCFLLVSEIPLFALKFKTTGFNENRFQYILITLAVILLPLFRFAAIPVLILSYLFLSLLQKVTSQN